MSQAVPPTETILEPDLPIVDPHHHLWDRPAGFFASLPAPEHGFAKVSRRTPRYLLDELLADFRSGHNIRASVFVQCGAMYRADGPPAFRPVGETEFVNGIAAMCASGIYGEVRACAGIVGHVDLTLGEVVSEVLEAHLQAGGGRFRGIRHSASYDADPNVLGPLVRAGAGLYAATAFREGYARLARYGLSFDTWLLEPQLPDLIDLVRAFPDTPVILDHVGTPLGIASYAGRREERFPVWRANIGKLAALPNVSVKLGGLAMAFCNFPSFLASPPAPSSQLAAEWKPYIEACIEAFGVDRCMFESNFPVDLGSCSYAVLWNALKRIVQGYSSGEKTALFSGTATRVYRLQF
ncbi:MAG TPA: amidohydrolase family protein [Candidatus Sulfotelmatobacter sp.]|nr:amidohydrolase family protein [Candidatus Sulfotelmatobacter sp.]